MDAGCERCGQRLAEGEEACRRCPEGCDVVARCSLCDLGFPLCRAACPGCGHRTDLQVHARLCEAQGYRHLTLGSSYRALRSFEALATVRGMEPRAWVGACEVRISGGQPGKVRDELSRLLRRSALFEPNQTIVYACVQLELPGASASLGQVLKVIWGTKSAIRVQAAEMARWTAAILQLFPGCVPARVVAGAAAHALGEQQAAARHLVAAFTLAPTEEIVRLALVKWLGDERAVALEEARARDARDSVTAPPIGGLVTGAEEDDAAARAEEDGVAVRSLRALDFASPAERREQRFRERLGPLFHTMVKAVLHPRTRASGFILEPCADEAGSEADATPSLQPDHPLAIEDPLRSADALADAGELHAARTEIELALARDLDLPGGMERWRRWGAELRERELGRSALIAGANDAAETRRALGDLARDLEIAGLAPSAAVAWALAGDETARLRLLAQPEVCDVLARRLGALVGARSGDGDEGHAGDGGVPAATLAERERISARVRQGDRRQALAEARARLAEVDDPWLAEVAALLVALAVRGPRVDVVGDDTLRLALGARVTLGRRGATVLVAGPGVAPEHLALWRDEHGAPVAADTGTAMGTTLAGARVSAPLPIGASLLLHLGGRVEVRASAPSNEGPLVVDVGAGRYCVPLGPAYLHAGGQVAGADDACWRLEIPGADEAPRTGMRPDDAPWVSAASGPRRVGNGESVAGAPRDLCFGDLLPCGDGFLPLEVRPPQAD